MAHALANAAAAVILPRFRIDMVADHKGGRFFDPVTEADRAAERAMREIIKQRCPGHGIVGEELGIEREDAEFCWILDPIDGTRPFIMGQPLWGTLIGLLHETQPLLGMMDQPFIGERFWAIGGETVYQRGKDEHRIRTRACAELGEALLAASTPDMFQSAEEYAGMEAITKLARMRRFGGDCYNYCLLAMGQIDLVVEADLKPYDIIPLIPIVESAGGIVTTWDGGDPRQGGRIVAAGGPELHEKAVEVLSA